MQKVSLSVSYDNERHSNLLPMGDASPLTPSGSATVKSQNLHTYANFDQLRHIIIPKCHESNSANKMLQI